MTSNNPKQDNVNTILNVKYGRNHQLFHNVLSGYHFLTTIKGSSKHIQ